jgi:glycosyltransferase involved in cell wall biosynthesis
VVVPAHDEQTLLPACLAALAEAAATAGIPVEVVVVADACTDATAALAAAAGAQVVTIDAGNVGRARAAGFAHVLRPGGSGPDGLWLATTDADSRVPAQWLRRQLRHDADLVVGTVRADDWTRWPAGLPDLYERRYRGGLTEAGHTHVHGANLGFTARAYLAAGGFPPLAHDEDRVLVERMVAAGARVVRDPGSPVLTNTRAGGRAPNGFSAYLRALAAGLG